MRRHACLRLTRAACLVGALGLLAACGADGEPEPPTRDASGLPVMTLR